MFVLPPARRDAFREAFDGDSSTQFEHCQSGGAGGEERGDGGDTRGVGVPKVAGGVTDGAGAARVAAAGARDGEGEGAPIGGAEVVRTAIGG